MRKVLLLFFASAILMAQETVNLSMGGGYLNEVYFKFSDESSSGYDRDLWHLAFLRTSVYDQGIRVNEGRGLNVYEASDNIDDWDNLDLSAANGDALHNSETAWGFGAFNMGSAPYGWGYYDDVDHHVLGSVIFLIEDYASSTYYKLIIEDYFGGYTIKYALWNGSGWDADQTAVIPNSTNNGHLFNYFNLESGTVVDASPALNNWDIVFKRYSAMVTDGDGNEVPYTVTGVLQNPNVTVAHVEEAVDGSWADISSLNFSEDINSIGYNWKQLNSSWSYDIVPDQVYYVKSNDIVYRMFFSNFDGISTGNITLNYIAEDLKTVDEAGNIQFAVYPNPVKNNQITLVYDNAKALDTKSTVLIYNLTGKEVFKTTLSNNSGLFQKNIQLNALAKGMYILKFVHGNDVHTEKLIIK